jgi:hypothetical protein
VNGYRREINDNIKHIFKYECFLMICITTIYSLPPSSYHHNIIAINEITTESNKLERTHYNVMGKKDLEAEAHAMYKLVDIHSANTPLSDGVNRGGNVMSEKTGNKDLRCETRSGGKNAPCETRLTPERLVKMKIGRDEEELERSDRIEVDP